MTTFYCNIFRLVRNPIWSGLIHFGQIWSKKIKNKAVIFILSVNVTTYYCNIFRLVRNPIWSNLIHFGQIWSKKIKNITGIFILSVNVTTFYSNIFRLVRNPLWSSLIHFGQIWSKKIKNKTAIFILFKNVTTFYTNIFWYVQPLRSLFLQKDTHSLRRKPHRHRSSNSSWDISIKTDNFNIFYFNSILPDHKRKNYLQFFMENLEIKRKVLKQFWIPQNFDYCSCSFTKYIFSQIYKFFVFNFSPPPTPPPRGLKRDTSKGCLVAAAVGRRIVRQQLNSTLSKAR